MKILVMIFTLLFSALPAKAQDVGFFIPQKTLEMMQRPEQLAPLRLPQQVPATRQRVAPPTANSAATGQPIKQPTPQQFTPSKAIAIGRTTPPSADSLKTAAPTATVAADTRSKTVEPRPAEEPMIPQTDVPVIPVTIDDLEGNNPPDADTEKKPATEPEEKEEDGEHEFSYDDIIKEYRQDIQKISQNQPVANERLDSMLQNYHDEVLIF